MVLEASWWRLPINGNFGGPGGKFVGVCFFKSFKVIVREIINVMNESSQENSIFF